jgi:hypothetical protein
MPDPLVIQKINEWRERLAAQEMGVMRQLAKRWMAVEEALQADMQDLATYLDELRKKGEVITQARLQQMDRYRSLISHARAEHAKYSAWAEDLIKRSQAAAIEEGIASGQAFILAALADANQLGTLFDRLNAAAINFQIGFAADGSPLNDLLRGSYPETVVRLTDDLVNGLARGIGPRASAILMARSMSGNLTRAVLIARTEQIRALRAANLQQMQGSKVVSGYIRRAQRNGTVCAACLALDGTEQASAEIFASHPNCQCYAQPVLKFGKTPAFQSGPEWLAEQPESMQRLILGKGRFEAYQSGGLDWGSVARVHEDPVWGPTIRQTKLAQITA